MPVERQDVDTLSVLCSDASQKRQRHHDGETYKTDHDVKAVKTHQRVIGCSEQIGTDRQSFVVNQPAPLRRGPVQEGRAQRNGREPQDSETQNVILAKRLCSHVNCETARKQTDRVKDRDNENVLWHGARQALADIEKVCHQEDRENRSFGGDQSKHADASTSGTVPLNSPFGHGYWCRTHHSFPRYS